MREIEAFLAVAEQLHFGRAAESLRVTPSRVSQAVRALERRIGAPLFDRTSRRVELTPLGRELDSQWRPAYTHLARAFEDVRLAASGPVVVRLRVGYPATLVPARLADLEDFYTAQHPHRRLLWLQDQMLDVYRYRPGDARDLDVLLGWFPPGQRRFNEHLEVGAPIREVPPLLLVASTHPLAHRPAVDIEELVDYPLMRPGTVADLGIEWVPATTPAGRALRRVTRADQHIEAIFAAVFDEGIAHVTPADLPDSPAWNLVRGRAVPVPLTGYGAFTVRAVWPVDSLTAVLAADFAEMAHRAGTAAGWLASSA